MTRPQWIVALVATVAVVAGAVALLTAGSGDAGVALSSSTSRHSVRLVVDSPRAGTTAIDVEVTGESSVDGVRIEPAMPHMGHAVRPATTAPAGRGRYRAENVLLEMSGQWEITVVVEDARGTERVIFPLLVS
ncbi:FixH family protein [Allokutzneria oryzae]|uniref:FixH family protein n=1 Tax=Allokutzneria oryzae TaxID=1378989 RepID=A0ABV5ZXV9_9PSEU